jgi:hypothetical protein
MQALGLLQTAMALTVFLAPQRGSELAGMSWDRATGEALFGWRLFALRQLCLGVGGLAGVKPVRAINRYLQPADLALCVHAHRTHSVPRRTASLAIVAATCALGCLLTDNWASRQPAGGEPIAGDDRAGSRAKVGGHG